MAYVALIIELPGELAERYADALLEAGALCVDAEDARAGTDLESPLYGEPGEPAQPGTWAAQRLTALFPAGADIEAALDEAAAAAGDDRRPESRHVEVPERDWVRLTQSQFAPIRIDARLWIVPSWSKPVDPSAINLVLDPGLAFGTGSHPTTRLCLRWLVDHPVGGRSVLDYGCGSGILAIAASKLGADRVVGVDVDQAALDTAIANAARNEVDVRFCLPGGEAAGANERYDVVIANILTNPLKLLAPVLAARARAGGRLLLSGVLDSQYEDVRSAYEPWFELARYATDDGWVAIAGSRRLAA